MSKKKEPYLFCRRCKGSGIVEYELPVAPLFFSCECTGETGEVESPLPQSYLRREAETTAPLLCPDCGGTGVECPSCGGTGFAREIGISGL